MKAINTIDRNYLLNLRSRLQDNLHDLVAEKKRLQKHLRAVDLIIAGHTQDKGMCAACGTPLVRAVEAVKCASCEDRETK